MTDITVVDGGLAGLVAAITAAEQGAKVQLYEAHQTLGGRARSSPPPFVANDGPHALYDNGEFWPWLIERDLIGRPARPSLGALAGFRFRFRWQGLLRRRPPATRGRRLNALGGSTGGPDLADVRFRPGAHASSVVLPAAAEALPSAGVTGC
jgi:glycine/D-amino acid oxidase-like deaminating enzyme